MQYIARQYGVSIADKQHFILSIFLVNETVVLKILQSLGIESGEWIQIHDPLAVMGPVGILMEFKIQKSEPPKVLYNSITLPKALTRGFIQVS